MVPILFRRDLAKEVAADDLNLPPAQGTCRAEVLDALEFAKVVVVFKISFELLADIQLARILQFARTFH